MSLKGRVVLVAGGTGGLGRAVSLAFLNEGAKVAVTHIIGEEFTRWPDQLDFSTELSKVRAEFFQNV